MYQNYYKLLTIRCLIVIHQALIYIKQSKRKEVRDKDTTKDQNMLKVKHWNAENMTRPGREMFSNVNNNQF